MPDLVGRVCSPPLSPSVDRRSWEAEEIAKDERYEERRFFFRSRAEVGDELIVGLVAPSGRSLRFDRIEAAFPVGVTQSSRRRRRRTGVHNNTHVRRVENVRIGVQSWPTESFPAAFHIFWRVSLCATGLSR